MILLGAYICFGIWIATVLGFGAWAFWDRYKFNRFASRRRAIAEPIPFQRAGPIEFPHSGGAEHDAPEDTQ